jgi:hypothetical protein
MSPINDLPIHDIHVPEPIGFFPPAIGWWLIFLIVPIVSYLFIAFAQKLKQKKAIKEAKLYLGRLEKDSSIVPIDKIREISMLLRRVALSYPRKNVTNVAELTGRAWLDYLDSSFKSAPFKNGVGRCLVDLPYQKSMPHGVDLAALFQLAYMWIDAQNNASRR